MNMPLKDALCNLVHEINRKAMHFSVKVIQRRNSFQMLNGSSLVSVCKINAINADASHSKVDFEQGVWDIESVK